MKTKPKTNCACNGKSLHIAKPKTKTLDAKPKRLTLNTEKLLKVAGIERKGGEYFFLGDWIPNSRGQEAPYLFREAAKLADEQWQIDLLIACNDQLEVIE